MKPEIQLLLEVLDSAYDRKGWHGTTLKGSLRGLQPELAEWRPAPDRRNIWEYAAHAAYWKYVVRRRLVGEKRGSFPLPGSDWFESPSPVTVADIRDLVRLLDEQHALLRQAIESLRALPSEPRKRSMLHGAAAHDLYHTGQIQLLKKLAPRFD